MNDDEQHLKLLVIFHYVLAGFTTLVGCFPVIHMTMGLAVLSGRVPLQGQNPQEAAFLGWIFAVVGGAFIVTMWSLSVVILFAGRSIGQRRRRTFCLVVAGLECLMMPFGTALGVFTIIVLMRPSVEQLFREQKS